MYSDSGITLHYITLHYITESQELLGHCGGGGGASQNTALIVVHRDLMEPGSPANLPSERNTYPC